MTVYEILDDIRSDRVKKCIIDSDMYNEMDDQYALAHALGAEKIEVLSVNAEPFYNGRCVDFETGMVESVKESYRILEICGRSDIPVYEGSRVKFTAENDYAPIDSPAARNIVKTAMESDEIIYILATGCCSNVTSAILMEPKIKEKICVIWLGGHELDFKDCHEFNLSQDWAAGQILINSGVPLVLVPAGANEGSKGGTCQLWANIDTFKGIKGDGKVQKFFREDFPNEFVPKDRPFRVGDWDGAYRVIYDIAAPGILNVPSAFGFEIVPAPVFCDNKFYGFDSTRHKIIYINEIKRDEVYADMFKCVERL